MSLSLLRLRSIPRALLVLALAAALTMLAGPASARAPKVHFYGHHTGTSAFNSRGADRHSFADGVWGGYVATGQFGNISGSWTEPQVSCNSSNDLFAPWIGLDGYGSQSVEQAGVQTDCSSGSPVYSAWYEMYPAAPVFWNDPVGPGDSMSSTISDDGSGNYTLTLTDNSQGWTETTQQSYPGQDASAEAVIESPSNSYPSFDSIDFSGITVDGQVFDNDSPQAITSGGYGPTALQNGAFSIVPGGGGFLRHHR